MHVQQRQLMVIAMSNEHKGLVGYQHPPIANRFKPGVSGNPSGRPKKIKSLQAELIEELGEVMRVNEGHVELEVSKARAIAKFLVRAAVDGNLRAATALLTFCAKQLGTADDGHDPTIAPDDADILNEYVNRELRRRASQRDVTATDNAQSNSIEQRSDSNGQ
jgi:hypothetical protein